MINRLILWLALAGMILALHLWIQKARDFDQGCLGLNKPVVTQAAEGCREVGRMPASHLLGVSNAAWGYAFYFGLALASFAKILARPEWARRLHRMGAAAVAGALVYSVYLVYQMGFVAQAWCVLCLTSALLVAALAALHAVQWRRGGFQPVADAERGTEVALAVGGLFAASGVLVAVLLFVNRLGTRPVGEGSSGREFDEAMWSALTEKIDGEKLRGLLACRYDPRAPTIDPARFMDADLPFLGRADGVPVIVFLDPNCGACRRFFPEFLRMADTLKDRARIMIVPRPLWDWSMPAVDLLLLARRNEDYFELWRRLYAREIKKSGEMTRDEIRQWLGDLGIETDRLAERLAAARGRQLELRARAVAAGVSGTPWVTVAGRRVWPANVGPTCIERLVDENRAAGPRASGATPASPP